MGRNGDAAPGGLTVVTDMDRGAQPPAYDALLAERADVAEQIASLTRDFEGMVAASTSSNSDDEHDPEGATIAFERAQVVAVLELGRRRLDEIDAALRRIAAGSYGRCESCGREISAERLAARPSAAACIRCAGAGRE